MLSELCNSKEEALGSAVSFKCLISNGAHGFGHGLPDYELLNEPFLTFNQLF